MIYHLKTATYHQWQISRQTFPKFPAHTKQNRKAKSQFCQTKRDFPHWNRKSCFLWFGRKRHVRILQLSSLPRTRRKQIGTRLEIASVKRILRQNFFYLVNIWKYELPTCWENGRKIRKAENIYLRFSFMKNTARRSETFLNRSASLVLIVNLLILWSSSESVFLSLSGAI